MSREHNVHAPEKSSRDIAAYVEDLRDARSKEMNREPYCPKTKARSSFSLSDPADESCGAPGIKELLLVTRSWDYHLK